LPSPRAQSVQPNSCSRRTPKCVPAVWLAATALAAFAACDTPGVTLIGPDRASGRDTVTLHVQLEDTALARALGWENGVPGAEVQLHRTVDPFQPRILHTDSTGSAYISNLLPGLYKIAGHRALSTDESAPTGNVIRVFGDGFKQEIAGTAKVTITLVTDSPGSLVISEVFDGGGTGRLGDYVWAGFFELYNNSDSTVYLDGMLLGKGFGWDGAALFTCEEQVGFREDPAGLWSQEFHQFPGAGSDYPVAPGQVVTIAVDAVDHSQVDPTFPNLSQADFEFQGSADPDNPDVPNMPPRGPRTDVLGHGMLSGPGTAVVFLAQRVDVATLVSEVTMLGRPHVRIPAERVLDVRTGAYETPDTDPAPYLAKYYCLNWVNREFDRLEAVWYRLDGDNRSSMHRRVLRTVAGRTILQDLNTSRLDLVIGLYSPGTLEY
jgi:hypothetical protein